MFSNSKFPVLIVNILLKRKTLTRKTLTIWIYLIEEENPFCASVIYFKCRCGMGKYILQCTGKTS